MGFTDDACIRYGIVDTSKTTHNDQTMAIYTKLRAVLVESNRVACMVQMCKRCKTRNEPQ